MKRSEWFITAGGRRVFIGEPAHAVIAIEDIAASLSKLCRFCGHCEPFYSVAQHSVHVSHLVPRRLAKVALLHDATEAYLGDVIRPLKHELQPRYQELEEAWWEMGICQTFDLRPTEADMAEVKRADLVALATERRDLCHPASMHHAWTALEQVTPDPAVILPLPDDQARELFLYRWGVVL